MIHSLDRYADSFGGRVKQARNVRQMEQKELAQRVGVTVLAIKNIENKNTEPKLFNAAQIARTLGVTLEYLIYGKA